MAACRMYTGEFLPSMIGEDWVSVRNAACREQYFYCMNEACRELMSRERYEELVELAHAAAEIYPFEEWQEWEIDGLIALARFKEAMEVYERTTKKTLDEFGLAPSPERLKRFRIMGERMSQAAGAIDDIRHRLVEKEKRRIFLYVSELCGYLSCIQQNHGAKGNLGIYHALYSEESEEPGVRR